MIQKVILDDFLKEIVKEDFGRGDLFRRFGTKEVVSAHIKSKEDCVFSGRLYAERLCELGLLECKFFFNDGDFVPSGSKLADIKGAMHDILSIERAILNLLEHSSGIASKTREYADAINGTGCLLLDTRKTRPLLREFEKYSTRNGGATNHRGGLDDCLMLKDTHLCRILDLKKFIALVRPHIPWTARIEVECENILMAKEALEAGIDILMCDNMGISDIKEVVKMRDEIAPNTLLEASGNINLQNIRNYAQSGVEAISCGAITHQAKWIDMSMKID